MIDGCAVFLGVGYIGITAVTKILQNSRSVHFKNPHFHISCSWIKIPIYVMTYICVCLSFKPQVNTLVAGLAWGPRVPRVGLKGVSGVGLVAIYCWSRYISTFNNHFNNQYGHRRAVQPAQMFQLPKRTWAAPGLYSNTSMLPLPCLVIVYYRTSPSDILYVLSTYLPVRRTLSVLLPVMSPGAPSSARPFT